MTIMFDSVTLSEIPSNPPAVAGYVGGFFPTFSRLVARFPAAKHLSIAVHPDEDAECLDIESGDAVVADAPAWVKRQHARGVTRPVVYADTSTMPGVVAALGEAGINRSQYRVWTAHYTGKPHVEPGSDGTQWTDRALARNLDESMLVASFFADPAPPPAHNAPHYDLFATGPFGSPYGQLNERRTVEQYDGARKHPVLQFVYLKWVLEPRLQYLADRVAHIARSQLVDGKPSWGVNHRGYRYQQLVHRAQGQRFV